MNRELLIRYIVGEATEDEKGRITQWLDSDSEHMREFLALRKLYDITLWQSNEKNIQHISESKSGQGLTAKKLIFELVKVAAIFVITILGALHFLQTPKVVEPVAMQTIRVPAGQRAELTLTDGSRVWLNAKTTFIFPNHFDPGSRIVTLDGEGYFEVVSNKKQPFTVKTPNYDLKVWGTKFNVLAYSGKPFFETALFEGSVELLNPGGEKGELINPNERIFLDNDRLKRGPISNYNHFLWKEGMISFDNESFPEMVRKLELYFDLKIVVKNKSLLSYTCTGKFRTKDGVDHILKVLQLSNHFRFKIDDKLNIITID